MKYENKGIETYLQKISDEQVSDLLTKWFDETIIEEKKTISAEQYFENLDDDNVSSIVDLIMEEI